MGGVRWVGTAGRWVGEGGWEGGGSSSAFSVFDAARFAFFVVTVLLRRGDSGGDRAACAEGVLGPVRADLVRLGELG